MDVRSVLGRLVSYDTYENELAMQLHLRTVLEDLGLRTELQEVLPGRPNLVAWRGRGGPLFVTHSDTFASYNHSHPLELRANGDVLYGRGVLDAKGQIAALVEALSLSTRPCAVALTVDEEKTALGSEVLSLEAEGAVVLEPTNLGIAVAEAGFVEVEFKLRGEAAHCSLPEAGSNAILRAFDLYNEIRRLPFMQASHPLFPPPWTNLGLLRGGVEPNVVPEFCLMQLDVAVLPGVELEDAVAQLRRLANSPEVKLKILDLAPPFETPRDAKVVTRLQEAARRTMGQDTSLIGMRSWTDAENLVKKGIPTVVYGAGELGIAHSGREAVSLTELETMARTLASLIDYW